MKKRKTRKTEKPTPPEEFSTFKAIIIDDEEDARNLLRIFLKERHPNIQVIGEADSVRSGQKTIEESRPDLIFLDVQMKDGTGFDLLDQLPEINFWIIFVTSYDQYAIEAFRFNAIDYLLKPIDPEEFERTVERLLESARSDWYEHRVNQLLATVSGKEKESLLLSTDEGYHVIRLEELIFVESQDGYTFFYMESGEKIVSSKSLGFIERQLPDWRFFRTHKTYLVNLKKVQKIRRRDGDVIIMEGEHEVPLARRKRDPFYKILSNKP